MNTSENNVFDRAVEFDIGGKLLAWSAMPAVFATDVLDKVKRMARMLAEKGLAPSEEEAANFVCQAVGMRNAEDMERTCKELIATSGDHALRERQIELKHKLYCVLPLMVQAEAPGKPSEGATFGMMTFGRQLASVSGAAETDCLDAIAFFHGKRNWQTLTKG